MACRLPSPRMHDPMQEEIAVYQTSMGPNKVLCNKWARVPLMCDYYESAIYVLGAFPTLKPMLAFVVM